MEIQGYLIWNIFSRYSVGEGVEKTIRHEKEEVEVDNDEDGGNVKNGVNNYEEFK